MEIKCKQNYKQECIPVGCVPATHMPESVSWGGGGWVVGVLPRGVCVLPGGGGASGGRGGIPACAEAAHPREQNDRCKNITLATTSLRPVMK